MARMIPDTPKNCTEASREKILFESLSRLDDEYYVFHSFESNHVIQKVWTVNETDFVIFHPQKGILVIESKADKVDGFTNKLSSTITVAEETGALDKMLFSVANQMEYDSEMALNRMVSYLEPVMIVVMAVVVGFIMIAVIQPIYGSYEAIAVQN